MQHFLSPRNFNSGNANVFIVNSNGNLNNDWVDNTWGVRPVINLKADTQFSSGDGTSSNPYVVS